MSFIESENIAEHTGRQGKLDSAGLKRWMGLGRNIKHSSSRGEHDIQDDGNIFLHLFMFLLLPSFEGGTVAYLRLRNRGGNLSAGPRRLETIFLASLTAIAFYFITSFAMTLLSQSHWSSGFDRRL